MDLWSLHIQMHKRYVSVLVERSMFWYLFCLSKNHFKKAVLHNKMRSSALKLIYCSIPQYTCDTIPTWLYDTVLDIVSNAEFVVVLTAVLTSYLQQSAVTIMHMYMLSGYYTFVFYRWLRTRTHVKLINARNHFVPRFTEVPLC